MSAFDSGHAEELGTLLAVADAGSFVGAARVMQRHPTVISKRIAALENRLGVRLIERTTRQLRLTECGSKLVERLRSAASLIDAAQQEASFGASEIGGNLRLSFPGAMGRMWIAPLLPEFLNLYPALHVEADFSDRYVDIVGEGFDAALRVGKLADNRLIARKIGDHKRILCASPDYLERHGTPVDAADLALRQCLEFTALPTFPHWTLSNGAHKETVTTRAQLRSSDSVALLEAARSGIGILGAGEWLAANDIAAGTLVRVLPDWSFDTDGGIYLVRPSVRHPPARTEAFAAWLTKRCRGKLPWQ